MKTYYTDYRVVEDKDVYSLGIAVDKLLDRGYTLIGGVSTWQTSGDTWYNQAVAKPVTQE